jgi:hypothetical protein
MSGPTTQDHWAAAHCRVFRSLFTTCGQAGVAAALSEPPALALTLTSLAGQFAWHAELCVDLLPTRAGTDAEALVATPLPGTDAALAALAELGRADDPAGLVAALGRVVVPRLRSGVATAHDRVDARVDGPRARALTLIGHDLDDAARVLEPQIERSMATASTFEDLVDAATTVERALVDAGIAVGIVA